MQDKIEILLATYNGERYIEEQIESILNQDYKNWVVRVCDDASTDHTFEILKQYYEKYPDKFLIEKKEKGSGTAKTNFFYLMKQSTCDYVMCCDQDDVWLPNKISLTMQEMKRIEKKEVPCLVHTDLKVVNDKLEVLGESFFVHSNLRKKFQYREVLIQNHVTGCTMMMNRALIELLCEEMDYTHILMHDWLAAIVASAFGKVGFVDCPTMLYRQHAINSVGAKKYGVALLLSKLKDNSIRRSLEATAMQAGVISKVYKENYDKETYKFTVEYSNIYRKWKGYRICFYIKQKMWKKGLPRQVWQLILG